jgi:molybdate-binding protein
VSRQLVGSVEAGVHAPRVDAALGLSQALGSSVEELFAAASPVAPSVRFLDQEETGRGSALVAAEVGARTVVARVTGSAARGGQPWMGVPEAIPSGAGASWLPGADRGGALLAGCDPSLGLVSALLPRRSGQHLVVVHASSALSARWLEEGSVHAAVVHGRPDQLVDVDTEVDRYLLTGWQVGLAGPEGIPLPSVEELCDRGLPVVQREEGAGTQTAFLDAVHAVGAEGAPTGPVAASHLDATARVLHGAAAAVTMEPAAVAAGLDFAPLEEHVVQLWVARQFAAHPAVAALVELLTDRALHTRLAALPGYDVTRTGQRICA